MAGNAKYKNKWLKEKRDRFMLTMPKGRKAELKAIAEQEGKSLNHFINEAIDNRIEQLNKKVVSN